MQKRTPEKLAIFDFDGTLTLKDTTFGFLNFYGGKTKLFLSFFRNAPFVIMAMAGWTDWKWVKERLFKNIFGGHTFLRVKQRGDAYADSEIPGILHPSVFAEMQQLRGEGFEIALLSASCRVWLQAWSEQEKMILICSEMEEVNGLLTGKLRGENCYGIEKVNRLKELYDLERVKEIVAYGNHRSDFPYMQLAHKAYLVKGERVYPYEWR